MGRLFIWQRRRDEPSEEKTPACKWRCIRWLRLESNTESILPDGRSQPGQPKHRTFPLVADAKASAKNDGVLLKLRGLPWLLPSYWTAHVRYAGAILFRIHATNIFVDDLGQVACCLNTGWLFDERGQNRFS